MMLRVKNSAGSSLALLLVAALLADVPTTVRSDATCVICDNYFELNTRNAKDTTFAGRYCNSSMYLTGYRHTKCTNKDLNGCMKMTTYAWRYHIDKVGIGMRDPATLISTVVTRDCAEIPPGMGVGCHWLYGAGTTKYVCYCKGDGCNSSTRLASAWICCVFALATCCFLLLLSVAV